jgi:hypothetical protein
MRGQHGRQMGVAGVSTFQDCISSVTSRCTQLWWNLLTLTMPKKKGFNSLGALQHVSLCTDESLHARNVTSVGCHKYERCAVPARARISCSCSKSCCRNLNDGCIPALCCCSKRVSAERVCTPELFLLFFLPHQPRHDLSGENA